uniref:Uncharacterized protein n=1 Tax=Oryza punctata TaxID=4537 RepID=A0A0E0MHP0_ORYPU
MPPLRPPRVTSVPPLRLWVTVAPPPAGMLPRRIFTRQVTAVLPLRRPVPIRGYDSSLSRMIKKIPGSFESIEHYVDIHSNLLIEETRSTLNSAILDITKSQYCHILSMQYCGLKYQYFVDIDLKKKLQHNVITLKMIMIVLVSRNYDDDVQLEEMKYVIFLVNIVSEMRTSEVLSVAADTTKFGAINTILNLEKGSTNFVMIVLSFVTYQGCIQTVKVKNNSRLPHLSFHI